MESLIILVIVLALPLLYLVVQYNAFIGLRNQIDEAWSNIDTELKRRYDLIPNLVAVVKAYSEHERAVLERVTELRSICAANHGTPTEQATTENQLADALRQLVAVVENYPDLKADAGYLALHRDLVLTEDRIQAARRFFNGNVRDYRTKRESFPTNLIASMCNFGPREFLTIEPAVRESPRVNE